MHTVIRIGLWVLAVLLVLLIGTYAYLRNADLSVYETQIEGFLSEAIGHKVDVDGLFELHFGEVTYVTAEQITVTNPGWPSEPTILSVGHFSVSVDLWSLLRGPIVIEELDIQRVRVRLERNEESGANWDNGRQTADAQPKGQFDRNLVAFRELRVQDVQLDYVDVNRDKPLNVNLDYLTISPDATNVLDLDLRGTINDIPLWADGKLGPWTNLIDGKDVSADLNLFLGESSLAIDGYIADLVSLEGIETSLELRGPAIDRVIGALGLPPFAEGEFEVTANINAEDDGNQVDLSGKLGEIAVFVSGNIDSFLQPELVNLDFNFAGPDAKYVGEVFGLKNVTEAPFQFSGQFEMDGRRYSLSRAQARFATGDVNVDGWIDLSNPLPDMDLTINSSGPDFSAIGAVSGMSGMPTDPFELAGRILKNGDVWRIDDLRFDLGENHIGINGELDRSNATEDQIDVTASGPDISILEAFTGLQGIVPRPFKVEARIGPHRAGLLLEDAVAEVGENRLEIDGPLGTRDGLNGTDLSVRFSGPELMNISVLTGIPYLPTGPFELAGRTLINNKQLRLEGVAASVAGINATATGTVGLAANAGDFDFQLSANGPDLSSLADIDFLEQFSGQPFAVSGRLSHTSNVFKLDSISASVGTLRATIEGEFAGDGTAFDVRVTADAPNGDVLENFAGIKELPAGPVVVRGRIQRIDDDLEFSDTRFRIGDFRFSVDGTLSNSPMSNDSDLRFAASGPEVRQLGLPFGYGRLPARAFTVSGEVNGVPTGFAIENLVARVGENDIVAKFTADLRGKPEITGTISSTYVDLESEMLQSSEDEVDEESDVDAEFLFSNAPLDKSWLDSANFDIDVTAGRAILSRADVHDVRIRARLWDTRLDIEPFSFREMDGNVDARLHIQPLEAGYAMNASLAVENMHLGLTASPDHDRSTLPPLTGNFEISGTGNSVHELLGSANGRLDFRQGAGLTQRTVVSQFFDDLVTEVVRTINPLSKAETHNNLECGIFSIDITDGIATIENLALQSDELTIIMSGNVNFESEKLDISLRSKPREGFGVSLGGVANSFLKLGGTLRNPKIQIDAASSVATTGVAVATGGLSLLAKGLWDRVSAEADICKELE